MMEIRVVVIKEIVATPTTGIVADRIAGILIEEKTRGEAITIDPATVTAGTAFKVHPEEVSVGTTINRSHRDKRVTKNMDATGNLPIANAEPANMEARIVIVGLISVKKRPIVQENDGRRKKSANKRRFERLTSGKRKAVGGRKSECTTPKCPKTS
jgi:hypothetical protein